ncbi:MAG TPA: Na+/H+ antiporter subunit D [Actinomycetota bacterium]|nr:Na+/H+ antiporter subunit D [Actinomycetota bacterium]
MNLVLPAFLALPLFGAALSLALHGHLRLQRTVSIAALTANLLAAGWLLNEVADSGAVAVNIGGWPAPIGIVLVADLFSALMVVIAAIMVLAVLVYAIGSPVTRDQRLFFHPMFLVLAAGVSGSFLAGDLFNLFVAFEIMLSASYVLLTLGGGAQQVRSGMTYVTISLLASTLFITAVGLTYAATGTVNLADLAERIPDLPDGVRSALSLLFLVVFGIKAAIFPLFFWLPDSYPTSPTPVTAIFAGLLTKVGVYAIIRTQTLLFQPDGASTLLLTIAGATMLVGVLGAIAQDEIKRILSFHIVSQIGYMILGLGLFSIAGIAGAIFYILHHIVVKTTLFLVGGLIESATGTGALHRIGGLVHHLPLVAGFFLLPALSLAGLPPFSGFVAKLALVQEGLVLERYTVVGVSLLVSLLTLFSMTKIWAGAFWGAPDEEPASDLPPRAETRLSRPALFSTGALVAVSLVIAFAAGPIYELSSRAAAWMIDPSLYVALVLGK